MKTKIFMLIGILFLVSCSEDFITRELDKGRYIPGFFFDSKEKADQALIATYATLQNNTLANWHFLHGSEFYQTSFAAGWAPWNNTGIFNILNTDSNVSGLWNNMYANVLRANTALIRMPEAQEIAGKSSFSDDALNLMMGQAYFLRAWSYYILYTYYPEDRIVLRETEPTDQEYTLAPSTPEQTFAFIENDLKQAQNLLVKGLNTTSSYEKFRVTRGTATALLGHLYMYKGDYAKAAAEYKKLLPGVGDAAYGSYSLVDDYRSNFTKEGKNNNESIFEVQYDDLSAANKNSGFLQSFTSNRTSYPDMWWNFAVPTFKLDEFESWEETIGGVATKVYDYRVYETFWGVPNGAIFTYQTATGASVRDWRRQGWQEWDDIPETTGAEKVTINGVAYFYYGMRKMAIDNSDDKPSRGAASSDINWRIIRLADVMLRYAECLAKINPSNLGTSDPESAIYWIDKVRERANLPMNDQVHLYSARPGVNGKLPPVTELMAAKGWTLMQAVEHERYVEGFVEGWNREDMKRWKVSVDYIQGKRGWDGYQSLTLPVPLQEEERNPNNDRRP